MKERGFLLRKGELFQGFRVVRPLGQGGVGEVYEIDYQGERYALKVISTEWAASEADVQRTLNEGRILGWIKHPNVVRVHETGVTRDGLVWIRMERLRGQTMRVVSHRRGALSLRLACMYLRSLALAAHQCHLVGVIHRDIKPENVFLTRDEEVKLLDFGIAKLFGGMDTRDGRLRGTPLYMAPEQIAGRPVTPATDVYAIGMMAYELLRGRNPFVDDMGSYDLQVLYNQHFHEVPPSLTKVGIPAAIAEVVAKALHKDPSARQQMGLDFAKELWSAWESVASSGATQDTYPGEPLPDQVPECRSDAMRFGTGPSPRRALPRTWRTGEAAKLGEVQGPRGRLETAVTLPFVRAHGQAGRAGTRKLPESQRDPTCALARALGEDWDADEEEEEACRTESPAFAPLKTRSETRLRGAVNTGALRRDTLPLQASSEEAGPLTLRGAEIAKSVESAPPVVASRTALESPVAPSVVAQSPPQPPAASAALAATDERLSARPRWSGAGRQVGLVLAALLIGYLVRGASNTPPEPKRADPSMPPAVTPPPPSAAPLPSAAPPSSAEAAAPTARMAPPSSAVASPLKSAPASPRPRSPASQPGPRSKSLRMFE